ncbi:MAG: hypothetical protein IKJ25_00020, partial [Clostridia bacterium]|nr:hypothetical protein [Clostridia bacterium]
AAKAPTCTETGLTAGKKCSECDIVLEAQSTVPATGHKYDDEYDATCNNEGCDFVRDAACRHSNTETLAAKAATCTETGLTEGLRCKDCEEILTKQEIIPMVAHTWTLATCTAPKTCSVCKATEGEALGHHWKPATCTDPKTCQRENCGVTEGEALGHKWKDATCTAPQICSVCTATQGEALGHKWNNATCDAPKTCSVCKATEGSKLGHSYNAATYVWSADNKTCTATKVCKNDPSHVVTETANATIQTASATCTAGGSVTYTATFTKEGFAKQTKSTTTNKLDHAYGETTYSWSIDYSSCTAQQKCTRANCSASKSESADITSATTPATCKDAGKIVYTAKFENFASDTRTKVLPVTTNHHYVTDPAVDATCKEPGLTEGKHCDVCGKVEIEQTETALAPHTYDDIYDAECNVCGNIRDAACRHTNTETLAAVAPTCTTAGKTEGKKCLDCGETYVPQTPVSALGHDWADATCLSPKTCQRAGCGATDGEPNGHDYEGQTVTYTWNANNSKCTASIVCKTNPAHVNSEEVDVVITTEAPTCTEDGLKIYTATFTKEGFATQTKEFAIESEGHKYTVLVETVAPTCEAKGYTLYKCSGCDNTEQRDWQNSTGHTYGATSYEWNGYETCTATRACVTNGCGHTETATATATGEVTKPSTCTENGTKTYTATFDKAWATAQTKDETLDKLVHGYGDTTYVWANDYSSCTASRTCANCGTQTATATVTSVTTDPECEKAGKTVYTATFTQDWCETKTHTQEINALTHSYKVENTEAEGALKSAATCTKQAVYYRSCEHCGKVSTSDNDTFKSGDFRAHNYGDITYSWTGYTACTATRTCQYNDCQHHDSANATVDEGKTTTSATCTTAGVKTYTATFDKEGFETQTKTQEIPATGHTFGETVEANDATCILPGNSAYKQCTECELYFAKNAETNSTEGKDDTTSFVISTIPHKWLHRECVYGCGTPFESTVIFDFGENGTEGHKDGSEIDASKEFTENGNIIKIESTTKVYDGAFDAQNNSCLKLGTGKLTASFSFAVPTNVTKVVIYVAGYKANDATIVVNGQTYEITTHSDDGAYTAIEVDTSSTKTVEFATETTPDKRCMINKIEFNTTHVHDHVGGTATCENFAICDICDKTYGDYAAHTETDVPEVAPKCNAVGYTAGKYCSVCETYTEGHEEQAVVDHSYTNNVCIWCGTSNHTCSFTVEQSVVEPTCTEQGYTVYKCSYEGCTQTENGSYVDANGHTTLAEDAKTNEDLVCDACTELIVPVADDTLTIKQAIALGNRHTNESFTTDKYYITGTIISIANTEYGNMNISDGDKSLYIYGLYSKDGTTRYDAMATKPAVGDEITIYTIVGKYSNAPQAKNAWLEAHTAHECVWSEATCQAPKTCSICGATDGEKADHNYVDGECTVCGTKSSNINVSITFDNPSEDRTTDNDNQIWVQNGIKVTTTSVNSYYNPLRVYQNANLIVDFDGMTSIIFNCNTNAYATALFTSINNNNDVNAKVSCDGKKVTVELTKAVDAFEVNAMSAQVRIDSIDIIAEAPCNHEFDVQPTCLQSQVCKLCQRTVTLDHTKEILEAVAPTCIATGLTEGVKCSVCDTVIDAQETIPATGVHNYVDGVCTVCEAEQPTTPPAAEPQTVTTKYSGSTGNMGSGNQASILGLDANIFTVTADKGKASNNVGLNADGDFRLYYNASGSNKITFDMADGYTITSIKITFTSSSYGANCQISSDGNVITKTGSVSSVTVDINANSFELYNANTSNKQIRIKSVEITYVVN